MENEANYLSKISPSQKYILVLATVFLIGAAVGAFVFYRLNFEIIAPKITLAGFEKKLQDKIKSSNLSLLAFPRAEYANLPVDNFTGIIAKIESPDSFEVKVKNYYKTGSLIDFVLKQPDFYSVKVLVGKDTKIFDLVLAPPPADSGGLRIVGMLVVSERTLLFGDLKEGQEVDVFLEKAVILSEAAGLKAKTVKVTPQGSMILSTEK